MATGRYLDRATREQRLAEARAWRIRMKPYFDAIYGVEPTRCDHCGQRIGSR
ncbi:hypothetical protein SAMN05660666_03452 [Novosphingobium aromaticivorans]|nr:hypothetical protein [Novosphingobium aromaticivorans]SCY89266.1 hypothetical protein SAMN05660666_03452 [Novosphingobium aromaticivorans]